MSSYANYKVKLWVNHEDLERPQALEGNKHEPWFCSTYKPYDFGSVYPLWVPVSWNCLEIRYVCTEPGL